MDGRVWSVPADLGIVGFPTPSGVRNSVRELTTRHWHLQQIHDDGLMMPFKPLPVSQPALHYAPMLRATVLMIDHVEANGPVGLIASRAPKRYFVESAADAFDWEYYSAPDVYAVDKVLNESDFPTRDTA